ncbi:hypothetical protein D3C71_1202610 [compost metagenome]
MGRGRQGGAQVSQKRRTAVGKCAPQPLRRTVDIPGGEQQRGMAGLAAEVAGLGRAPIPGRCRSGIGRHADPVLQTTADQIHRFGMAEPRGAQIQRERGAFVAGHASPGSQQVGQVVLAPVQLGLRGLAVPDRREHRIDRRAAAEFMATAKHVHGDRQATIGGALEPEHGGGGIGRDPASFHPRLAEQELRLRIAALCGSFQGGECGGWIVLQLVGQCRHVERSQGGLRHRPTAAAGCDTRRSGSPARGVRGGHG